MIKQQYPKEAKRSLLVGEETLGSALSKSYPKADLTKEIGLSGALGQLSQSVCRTRELAKGIQSMLINGCLDEVESGASIATSSPAKQIMFMTDLLEEANRALEMAKQEIER